jgi:hypothetical protein
MGKYKQWLHHQEVGRRLRDQIASLEQERERVQKMAPTHPTTLPDLDNPIVASLLAYTRQGNSLSRGGDARGFVQIRSDADPERSRPAPVNPTAAIPRAEAQASAAQSGASVASLLARAEQKAGNPPAQARDNANAQGADSHEVDTAPTPKQPANGAAPQASDSVGGWWQRYRPDDQA